MMDDMRVSKVSYHGGSMFALVKAATPEQAVEIAKAHREKKRLWSQAPQAVLSDRYEVVLATERDIAWARKHGSGVLTDMPAKPRKTVLRARKPLAGVSVGAEATTRVSGTIGEAA